MAHTCTHCGGALKTILAPTVDGVEGICGRFKAARRLNGNYKHDLRSWKRTTKARRQWARHAGRL